MEICINQAIKYILIMKSLYELLKGKVVNCQTEEEAKEFISYVREKGYRWIDDTTLKSTLCYNYGKATCYNINRAFMKISYSDISYYERETNYQIITYQQFKQLINENNMETKEVKIQVPEGYEIDKENSTFELIKFKPIKKVLTYEDVAKDLFCKNHHFLVHQGNIYGCSSCLEYASKKEVRCVSARQAEKLLAINKLMNVAKYLNEKENNNRYYYFLKLINGKIYTDYFTSKNSCYGIVCFNSNELTKKAVEILGEETIKLALSTDMGKMNKLFDVPVSQKRIPKKRQMSEFTKFKHDLYEQYKINMKQFGKENEIVSYRKWLDEVNNVKK